MKLLKVFSRYPTYIFVGGFVTLITVLIRSIIGIIIEDDTTARYMSSIVLSYIIGICLSFSAHKSITFKVKQGISIVQTVNFIAIHFVGMSITLLGSTTLRKYFLDTRLPIELSKMLAFAASAFMVSIITYILKKYMVFGKY